ncbi:type II secretion system GspH family protein [Chitiniphilus purpureus]|uniref:Type II secretion system GspH family protein n=1 Tax=Chitiniphilus purpureus TaxID=2981137 RepID=A0ABY6DPQ1_9NEIS|nr:type II secretion system GspH family protein [Chitiniphilus sp. CD1]UXY16360.1 type II secretion system GspH family protein [Chitiniphilus sp. CD1]
MCTRPWRRGQAGVTLWELLSALFIVSIAIAGVVQIYAVTTEANADPLLRKQALMVAEAMLEEVTLQAFSAPAAGYNGGKRALFDHVAAYNGYTVTGIRNADGVAVPGLEAYRVAVRVTHPAAAIGGIAADQIWVVTVTVSDGMNQPTVLTGYRFNYG